MTSLAVHALGSSTNTPCVESTSLRIRNTPSVADTLRLVPEMPKDQVQRLFDARMPGKKKVEVRYIGAERIDRGCIITIYVNFRIDIEVKASGSFVTFLFPVSLPRPIAEHRPAIKRIVAGVIRSLLRL